MFKLVIFVALFLCVCGELCENIIESGVSRKERSQILELHNRLRKDAARGKVRGHPRSRYLKPLVYNEELEDIAVETAENYCGKKSPVVDETYGHVGLVRYSYRSSRLTKGADWEAAINHLAKSKSSFDYRPIDSDSNQPTAYTQMIWGETTDVGCGYALIENESDDRTPYVKHYICHYYPSGNVIGELPYDS